MDELRNKPVNDVDDLLKELEREEVPAMTAEFEAQAMDRIRERKKEMDAEEPAARPRGAVSFRWRAWIAVAAAFVFLIGGTLLTRGKLRPAAPGNQPGIERPAGTPAALPLGGPEEKSDTVSFFEDMGFFVKAALPYLAGAGAAAAVYLVIRKKKTGQKP